MVAYVIATLLRPMRGRGAGLAPEIPPPNSNLYKAETDPENFARGGPEVI